MSSSTETTNISTLAESSSRAPNQARAKLACEACRANKARCFRGHGFSQACTRCLLQSLACTLPAVTKRRGRPPRHSVDNRSREGPTSGGPSPELAGAGPSPFHTVPQLYREISTSLAPLIEASSSAQRLPNQWDSVQVHDNQSLSSSSEAISGPSHGMHSIGNGMHNASGVNGNTSAMTGVSSSSGLDVRMSQPFSTGRDSTLGDSRTNNGSDPEQGSDNDRTNLDLSEYLDPADGALQVTAPNAPFFHNKPKATARREKSANGTTEGSSWDDPVKLMILSELEAHAMVELFHDRMNYLVAVLDSKLHTLQYLRKTSTVLFSAVLAVASRFGRADLHTLLLSHAQTLLDRAITAGAADVGLVQTIMILTYWKKPADTSAWRKIGIALRIGYQLYWHIPRTQPLPEDEMAARMILNVERTWFCLFSFDRGLSQTYGLPVTIRLNHMADAESWARSHLYLGQTVDMHVAFSIELCKLKDQWAAICDPQFPSSAYYDAAVDNIKSQCESLIAKWFTKECPQPCFNLEKEHIGLWCSLDFLLVIKRHNLENAPYDTSRMDACLADASRITDQIDILADNGELELMQDTESCMTSALVVLLRNIFHPTTIVQKSLIITLLQRILTAHTRAASGKPNTPTAYVARFVRRTLHAIGTESRAGSPMRGGEINGNDTFGGDGTGQPEFLAQLQEFMRMPEDLLGSNDDEYWSTLFST